MEITGVADYFHSMESNHRLRAESSIRESLHANDSTLERVMSQT